MSATCGIFYNFYYGIAHDGNILKGQHQPLDAHWHKLFVVVPHGITSIIFERMEQTSWRAKCNCDAYSYTSKSVTFKSSKRSHLNVSTHMLTTHDSWKQYGSWLLRQVRLSTQREFTRGKYACARTTLPMSDIAHTLARWGNNRKNNYSGVCKQHIRWVQPSQTCESAGRLLQL